MMSFPTLQGESIEVTLQFALLLRDGFANSDQLVGNVTVASGTIDGQQKDSSGNFLFYDLKPGPQSFAVSSGPDTPYYLPTKIAVTVPMPSATWPAFPDVTLANPNLLLSDPGQTAAYKAQRQLATLLPTNAYPFPAGTTLIRGTVLQGGVPLAAATVQQAGGTDPAYTTGADGQFVLFLSSPPGLPQAVTVNSTAAGLPAGSASVTVTRGFTVSLTINM
jgi:hypothetical protein